MDKHKKKINKCKKGMTNIAVIVIAAMLVIGAIVMFGMNKGEGNVDLADKAKLDITEKITNEAKDASDNDNEVILKSIDADATASLKTRLKDALNTTSGVSYLNGTVVTFIGGEPESSTIGNTAATSISVPFGATIPYFAYGTGLYGVEDEVKANSNPKPLVVDMIKYASDANINIEVFDQSANSFESNNYNTTSDTLTMTSVAITAGTTKCYDIKMQINSAIQNFGSTGLYLAHDAPVTKYQISVSGGSELDSMPNKMINDGMKTGYELDLNGILPGGHTLSGDKGLTTVATACVQLKTGQSGQNINWYIYDGAKYLSVDGKTVKDGISDDSVSLTDIGAASPKIVMTV